jgi:cytochrome c biogenesis protein CcmG/thiol:disulfide interchange protein DsbE
MATEPPSTAGPIPEPGEAAQASKHRRPWLRGLQLFTLGLVAGLLALLVWRVVTHGQGAQLVSEIKAQKKPAAPSFDLKVIWAHTETWPPGLRRTTRDGRLSLRDLRGYPVVLNFWASWCIPCKAEAPRLAKAARLHAGRVAFLGIDIQDFTSDAHRFLRRYRASYVSVRDGGSSTYDRYGLTGIPETYYVDRRGRILAHSVGQVSTGELEQGIALIARGSG